MASTEAGRDFRLQTGDPVKTSEEIEARQQEVGRRFALLFGAVFMVVSILIIISGEVFEGVQGALGSLARDEFPAEQDLRRMLPGLVGLGFFTVGALLFFRMRRVRQQESPFPGRAFPGGVTPRSSLELQQSKFGIDPRRAAALAITKTNFPPLSLRKMPDGSWLPHDAPTGGPVVVKPVVIHKLVAVATGVFALVWNGLVVFFVANAWHGWSGFAIFALLFALPFLGVGGFLIYMSLRSAASHGNPVPEIAFESDSVLLGATARARWRLVGNSERVEWVRLRLQAREETVHTRGTDTVRDSHTFFRMEYPVVKSLQGEVMISLPSSAMPSVESKHNRIVWELVVEGGVRGRPDLSESFRFWVNGERR